MAGEKVGSAYWDLDLDDKKFKKGLADSKKGISTLKDSFKKAEGASKAFAASLIAVGVGLLAVAKKGLDAAAEIETMRVALKTSFQGNEEAAKKAEKQIIDFAKKTPFQLAEVMNAFIKLKNMGLDPSEEAMASYGDTASAMGKNLNDMVEAVADAATGEFERLKEFGIRSSSEGDRVKFTFKGVTTEVGKNAEEIENYLISLGKINFAGGMEEQSKTLSGRISTLKDNFSLFLVSVLGKLGIVEKLKEAISKLTEKLEDSDAILGYLNRKYNENKDKIGLIVGAIFGALIPAFISLGISIWTALAPLIPFIAVGALLGLAVQKLIEHFGGWQATMERFQPILEQAKAIFFGMWEVLKWIGGLIMETVWPALQEMFKALWDLWLILEPYLKPVLKWVGIFLAGFFIAQIIAVIGFVYLLIKAFTAWANNMRSIIEFIKGRIELFKQKFVDAFNNIKEKIENFKNAIGSIGDFIKFALSGVKDAIIQPFKDAFDWISSEVNKVKDGLDKLNPFHKESPSLVDWITRGTDRMVTLYDDMYGRLNNMAINNRVDMVGSSKALDQAVTNTEPDKSMANSGTTVVLQPSGIVARSRSEWRDISMDMLEAANEVLKSKGQNPLTI